MHKGLSDWSAMKDNVAALIYPRGDIRMLSYVSRQTVSKMQTKSPLQARGAQHF